MGMRAILIDPYQRTILIVRWSDVPSSDNIYTAIGEGCGTFELLRDQILSGRDALYVDENAYLYLKERIVRFTLAGSQTMIVGRALVLGHTADGELCAPRTPLRTVRQAVRFV